MLYIGQRKGDSHKNHCEDSHFVLEHYNHIIVGVFDGCSTGVNSHFASELLSHCFKQSFTEWIVNHDDHGLAYKDADHLVRSIIKLASDKFFSVAKQLMLPELHMLSTVVVSIYNKVGKNMNLFVIGDGFYKINDEEYIIDSPNNTPDYLAYHSAPNEVDRFINSIEIKHFEQVESFCICSDGVTAIKPIKPEAPSEEEMKKYLLDDKSFNQSQAMLTRKFNLIAKHSQLGDDITIVRYDGVKQETNETIQQAGSVTI